MSKRVKGPDGMVRIFPDDATDEEIGTALEPPPAPVVGAHPEARISAARGGSGYFAAAPPIPDQNARPDSNMLSVGSVGIPPEAVLMGPLQAGRAMLKPGLSAIGRATAGAGSVLESVTPVIKYEVAKHALTAIGIPESVASVVAMGISGHKRGGAVKAAETVAGTVAKDAPVAAAEAAAVPAIEAAAAKVVAFNPSKAMTAAREAFATAGVEPLKAEASNVMELIRRGKAPQDALQIVLKNRPASAVVDPAAELARRLGTPSEAERIAAQDLRYTQGKVKTPSAETARSRR